MIIDIIIITITIIVIREYFHRIQFLILYQYVQVKSCYLHLSCIRSLSKKGRSRIYERFRKEINMLLSNGRFWKEINRLLSKGMWHIFLNVSIEKKWYTQNFDFMPFQISSNAHKYHIIFKLLSETYKTVGRRQKYL